jgi:hypothetical protein
MSTAHATNAVEIFLAMVRAARNRVPMIPHSASDKEYFAQDWFRDCGFRRIRTPGSVDVGHRVRRKPDTGFG